jgi:hypothetical protein
MGTQRKLGTNIGNSKYMNGQNYNTNLSKTHNINT